MSFQPQDLQTLNTSELEALEKQSPAFKNYYRLLKNNDFSVDTDLHLYRQQSWCQSVAATFMRAAHPQEICRYWSNCCDKILQDSWKQFDLDKTELCLFAMGKLGSEELNLSSDIDLMIVSDHPTNMETELQVKRWMRYLNQSTDKGFLFRVDMDLRPGGRFAPLIPSKTQFLDHYWGKGETWERLALIRLRAIAGPDELVSEILDLRKAFSYRKYLDFSVLQDLRRLRQSLFQQKKIKSDQINIKLEPGGIRDMELLIHALQVLHAGRYPDLQVHDTAEALKKISEHQLISTDEFNRIEKNYWTLRDIENRLQGASDQQTYQTKNLDELPDFQAVVDIINEKLGAPLDIRRIPIEFEKQQDWLSSYGYDPNRSLTAWKKILQSLNDSRTSSAFKTYKGSVAYDFVENISTGLNPHLGLEYLADFLQASRAKSSLFSVLAQSPNLVSDLSQLFSTSSYASKIVTSRPELIDSLFLRQSAETVGDLEELLEILVDKKFITEVSLGLGFLKKLEVQKLTSGLALLADSIIDEVSANLKSDFPNRMNLLKLGKWGRLEMSFKSDLDFIFVNDDEFTENDMKYSKRLISRLTETHRGGALYDIDLRLRPNGSSGPLSVTTKSLLNFLKEKADPWQRQSYYLCRSDDATLTKKIQKTIVERSFDPRDIQELAKIRNQVWGKAGHFDLKYSKGGLIDIEFAVQIALILKGKTAQSTPEGLEILAWDDQLLKNYLYLRRQELLMQFVLNQSVSSLKPKAWEAANMDAFHKQNWSVFSETLQHCFKYNYQCLKDLDPVLAQE